ncbi:SWI/SNF and RSC complex subunit Ssr2 [Phlyctochytrium planicorne]|nr:SWI/SNF and RSC complex subunit Ssr2 [Phlyctochytrium planicorne]
MFKSTFAAVLFMILLATGHCGLIVNKVVKEKYITTGKDATISIVIYNQGPDTAKNVIVEDKTFRNKSSFAAVSGKHSAKFATVEANANVSFSFVVKPIVTGVLPDHPAIFRYQVDKDVRSGYSASLASITILSDQEAARMESHSVQWGVYIFAGALASLIPFYLHYTADKQLNSGLKKEKSS